jgi:hypothetical protein
MVTPPKHPQRKILPFRVLIPMTILAALALSFFFLHRFHKAKQLEPRNRSSNAKIRSNAVDFVFKPLMQLYQHANSIFPELSPIR